MKTLHHKLGPARREKLRSPVKRTLPFYSSPEWLALKAKVIAERGNRCEDPDHDPAQPREGRTIYGDHVVELKDGGAPLDEANILLRCGACHGRKTHAARRERHLRPPVIAQG